MINFVMFYYDLNYLPIRNDLLIITRFHLFSSNSNIQQIIDEFDPQIGPLQLSPLWVRMGLGIIEIKEYSQLICFPKLEPRHRTQFSVILRF